MEKAYKLLAQQENISNNEAKNLIDKGLVYIGGQKLKIARGEVKENSKFTVKKIDNPHTLFEDAKILAVEKPAFIDSEELAKKYKEAKLLHRLDRETSGVILFVKDEEFREKAIEEFKENRVYKEYIAWVEGVLSESVTIDRPLVITKGTKARVKVGYEGVSAHTEVEPLEIHGKRTKVKVVIKTGRTHQIRAHLSYIEHPIIGDTQYGAKAANRIMLHAKKIALLGYEIESKEPREFNLNY